jgi:drug/metabolite transporter (DMT)-like permease
VAEELRVGSASVKIRSPWGVFFLALVTLGIYYVVWYYKINRELRDFGVGTSPLTSVLAITIGGLIVVPPFVSIWNTLGRIHQAEEKVGSTDPISRGLGFVLYLVAVFFLPFELVYMQEHLNTLWRDAAGR